jgi:uncharacterized protein
MRQCPEEVVLDTNVFVGAGFNPRSSSARLVEAIRDGRLRMIWNQATRDEIAHIVRQIPRLSWADFASLFREADQFPADTHVEQFGYVPDPADRKFAALAHATGATLVTSDADLLQGSSRAEIPILTPSEFVHRCETVPRSRGG